MRQLFILFLVILFSFNGNAQVNGFAKDAQGEKQIIGHQRIGQCGLEYRDLCQIQCRCRS